MKAVKIKYVYPVLSDKDLGWFRLSGPGLANCMFIAVRAYVESKKLNCRLISPTWKKFSIGPLLRKEKDKRIYNNLFYNYGISNILKLLLIIRKKWFNDSSIFSVQGLGDFFVDLNENYDLVQEYFRTIVRTKTIANVNTELLVDAVAIHVRLSDYAPRLRISINWYKKLMDNILELCPSQQFVIFSDGSDEELKPLLSIPNAKRVFFGNAFADIYAISKCKLLIASNSTFSAWGAYLGKVPIIFNKRHFPPVYSEAMNIPEVVIGDATIIPISFNYLFDK